MDDSFTMDDLAPLFRLLTFLNNMITAYGATEKIAFVADALIRVNEIIQQPHVLRTYSSITRKTVSEIQAKLETIPPRVRLTSIDYYNSVVPLEGRVRKEHGQLLGWHWYGKGIVQDWHQIINVNIKYFPHEQMPDDPELKSQMKALFVVIVLHELTNWLIKVLKTKSPVNPYADDLGLESGECVELELLGGRMSNFYLPSNPSTKVNLI
jgi:hypothetical protein